MLSRRLFATLPLALTVPHREHPRLDIEDVRHEPLDVGRTVILSISPDGKVLAGIRSGDRLCFLDATTLEDLVVGEPLIELKLIDRLSVHWHPDGSRIAFALDAWRRMRDSDIFVADVATATITNLTAEGHEKEAESILNMPDVAVDVYPRWVDDSTLLFARHATANDDTSTCEICTLEVESQAVESLVPLHPHGYRFVSSPLVLLEDGSMITTLQGGEQPSEIVIVGQDGELTPLLVEDVPAPELLDATATHALVWDLAGFKLLMVPLDNPSNPQPFADIFDYGDGYNFIGRPTVDSAHDALAAVALSDSSKKLRVFTMIDGNPQDHGYLGGEISQPACHLAANRLLITDFRNAWLIDINS